MRWTQSGAEALLSLRAVAVNADDYHRYRRCCQQQRLYGSAARVYELAEEQALKAA